jgi:undecaprenyl diphosphate synthase
MSTAGQTDSTGTPPQLPRHIAIIMDGNGRWARQRGLPRYAGHPAGVESVRKVVEHCVQRMISQRPP